MHSQQVFIFFKMSSTHKTKVAIIGSGPAGYTAAIYAARANIEPIIINGIQPGGQLTITTDVENYPGFAEAIQGPWLVEQMEKQAVHVGTKIFHDHIKEVDFSKRPFKLIGESGDIFEAQTHRESLIHELSLISILTCLTVFFFFISFIALF